MALASFGKWNSFNKARKDENFGIDVVDSMRNTLQILEMANASVVYFHMTRLPYPVKPKY